MHTFLWVTIPFLIFLFYAISVHYAWRYARPVTPLWLLVFVILIPPFLPLLLFYLLFLSYSVPLSAPQIVVVAPREGPLARPPLARGNRV
jgi:hypothetical protein